MFGFFMRVPTWVVITVAVVGIVSAYAMVWALCQAAAVGDEQWEPPPRPHAVHDRHAA